VRKLSELQRLVVKLAQVRLKREAPGCRGVCLDHLPDDAEIKARGVTDVVDSIVCDSEYWG
jgi:hypothetical protein